MLSSQVDFLKSKSRYDFKPKTAKEMQSANISKVIMWVTIAWVILVSYPRQAHAGVAAFAACVKVCAGPICAATAATGTSWLSKLSVS